eukprot:5464934-Pyramimonas_sp.AAC.1
MMYHSVIYRFPCEHVGSAHALQLRALGRAAPQPTERKRGRDRGYLRLRAQSVDGRPLHG